MGCNNNRAMFGRDGRFGVQRAMNCGFDFSRSHFEKKSCCEQKELVDVTVKKYPLKCEEPKFITIDRVTSLAGIDNALFLTGDIESGFRMNEDFVMVISDDLIGLQSFNFPAYLLLKAGDLHTLAVSTGDIENHPISAFLRGNQHMFGGRAAELFELAPQDFEIEENHEDCRPHQRHPVIRVIDPTSLNIRYITITVSWYEGCQFIREEIFFIIPLICQNGNTCKGGNLANWDDDFRTCGEKIRIPCNSTDNGALKIADKPRRGCGRGFEHGFEHERMHGRKIGFGGFMGNY